MGTRKTEVLVHECDVCGKTEVTDTDGNLTPAGYTVALNVIWLGNSYSKKLYACSRACLLRVTRKSMIEEGL